MSVIEEKCKQKGVRLTDQRKVIAKILSESKEVYGSKDHPDVDELHKRVTAIDDKISIATVYRTVKLFEEAGILVKHDFKAGKEYVCWYISYKNDEGYSTGLHYRQKKPEDDPYIDVDYRKVGKENESNKEIKIFPVQLKDEAVILFKEYLKKIII